jgi:two-component system, OmpR family, sensor histidine kinase MtrB
VSLRRRQDPGRVLLAVEDNGPGIPPEYRHLHLRPVLPRVVEAGSARAPTAWASGSPSWGAHAAAHGGRIWVEDRADGEPGARFVFELAIVEEP